MGPRSSRGPSSRRAGGTVSSGAGPWFLLVALALPACSGESAARASGSALTGKLILTGSSTVAPVAAEIGRRFEELHPGVRIDVQSGGSSRGIADARSGAADIGMASRALAPEEADLRAFLLARDGVCIILHRENPMEELSDEQVVGIYTGKIRNWKEVGGRDADIIVVNKAEGRATLEVFLGYFRLENAQVQADVVIGENEQGVKTVAGNQGAIGYVSLGTAETDARQGVPVKLLAVGGVAASTENLARGAFPLSRPLNLLTRDEPQGLARAFLDFAQSEAVHDLVRAQSFVPIAR